MKVKIGDTIFDAEKEPVLFIFETDEERKTHALNLNNMEPKEGKRGYVCYPADTPAEVIENFIAKELQ